MFDLAWSEIAVIGLVSVLVLGPKELPQAMRTMAKVLRKMRGLTAELQGHMNDIVRDAELEELRQSVQKFSTTSITDQVTKVVDPTGEIQAHLEYPAIETRTEAELAAVAGIETPTETAAMPPADALPAPSAPAPAQSPDTTAAAARPSSVPPAPSSTASS